MDCFELSEGWKWLRLADIAQIMLGKTPRRSDYANSGIKIVKFRDVNSAGINWSNNNDGFVANGSPSSTGLRYLALGDVLLTSSAHSAESIGKKTCVVGQLPGPFKQVAFVGELLCARANQEYVLPPWLYYWFLSKTGFEAISEQVEGVHLTQGRARDILIPIAPLTEQIKLIDRIEVQSSRIKLIRQTQQILDAELRSLLSGYYAEMIDGAEWKLMADVAPLMRRPVVVKAGDNYQELGIRSFGKGTFHKPALNAEQLGSKRIFHIHPFDLLFNIVFAWEGAVAIARTEDEGRVGSHRFLTCVPKLGVATAPFLYFHFTTEQGLHDLGDASPGGAGRNRTLGLKALNAIKVPVPSYEKQVVFANLWDRAETARRFQANNAADLSAYISALLDKAFRGEL